MIFGADRATTGRIIVEGRPVRIRGPRDAMAAGVVLLPGGPAPPGHGAHVLRAQEHHPPRPATTSGSARRSPCRIAAGSAGRRST